MWYSIIDMTLAIILALLYGPTLHFGDVDGELNSAFANSSVVVCGASYGIGAEIALGLCKAQTQKILLVARSEDKLELVKQKCVIASGGSTQVYTEAADLSTREGSFAAINRAAKEFDGHIDVLVLNHVISTYGDWASRLVESTEEGTSNETLELVEKIFQVNTLSYIYLSSYALPYLMKAVKPRILVVGSLAGRIGLPRVAPYSSSKYASYGYFEGLRQDLLLSDNSLLRKIHITNSILGSFDTESARTAAAATMKDGAVTWHPPDVAALDLLVALARGHKYTFSPWSQTRLLCLLHPLFPQGMDYLTRHIIRSAEL